MSYVVTFDIQNKNIFPTPFFEVLPIKVWKIFFFETATTGNNNSLLVQLKIQLFSTAKLVMVLQKIIVIFKI